MVLEAAEVAADLHLALLGKDALDLVAAEPAQHAGHPLARAAAVEPRAVRAGLRLESLSRERAERAKAELDEQTRLQIQQEEARLERERMLRDVADQFERTVGEVVTGVVAASSQLQSTASLMATTAEDASNRTTEAAAAMQEVVWRVVTAYAGTGVQQGVQ